MQRVTISIDDGLAEAFDAMVTAQGYASRSEAVRDLVRQAVDARRLSNGDDGMCVASLSYLYDHHVRDLAQRLTELQHDHHDVVIATTHVHLDHHACLESTMLRGKTSQVRALSDAVASQRGVRFASANIVSEKLAKA